MADRMPHTTPSCHVYAEYRQRTTHGLNYLKITFAFNPQIYISLDHATGAASFFISAMHTN